MTDRSSSSIEWPEELGSPLANGYGYTLGQAQHHKKVRGPTASASVLEHDVTQFTVEYHWNDQQLQRFHQFRTDDTAYMTLPFRQRLKTGYDLTEHEVKLLSVQPYQRDGFHWRVRLQLECPRLYVMDDSAAEFLLVHEARETLLILKACERYRLTVHYLASWGRTEVSAIVHESGQYQNTINNKLPELWRAP